MVVRRLGLRWRRERAMLINEESKVKVEKRRYRVGKKENNETFQTEQNSNTEESFWKRTHRGVSQYSKNISFIRGKVFYFKIKKDGPR
jgi:hypothetical protein